MSNNQSFRAGVGAIIFNSNREFLFVQLVNARENEWDFVKGGMEQLESYKDTLLREIKEEIGEKFEFRVLEKSNWRIVYDWPEELQKRKGFLGQVRTSFWVLALNSDIEIQKEELKNHKWISHYKIKEVMLESGYPIDEYIKFENEWKIIEERYNDLFN